MTEMKTYNFLSSPDDDAVHRTEVLAGSLHEALALFESNLTDQGKLEFYLVETGGHYAGCRLQDGKFLSFAEFDTSAKDRPNE